jgi:hypothetical protein
MPDSIEYIVRPHQTPNIYGSIIIPSTPSPGRERATIMWGGAGTMPEIKDTNENVNFDTVCCQEHLDELDRTSERTKVFNDAGDWIEVERPTTLRLKKKDQNHCLSGPAVENSGILQAVSDALDEFADQIHQGTTATGGGNCSVGWKFKNK